MSDKTQSIGQLSRDPFAALEALALNRGFEDDFKRFLEGWQRWLEEFQADAQQRAEQMFTRFIEMAREAVNREPEPTDYTAAEFGAKVGLTSYTVQKNCRDNRLNYTRIEYGAGKWGEYRLTCEELVRYRRAGLLPINRKGGAA